MAKKKAAPEPIVLGPEIAWKTAVLPGPLTMHFVAIGIAKTLDQFAPKSTTCYGPAELDSVGDRPPGLHIWTVDDADRVRKYRDWLRREWLGRPHDAEDASLEHLLGLEAGEPAGSWVDAMAAEGVAACWQGPISLGESSESVRQGAVLPLLVNRGEQGWVVALPYWPRSSWMTVSVFLRAADLFHDGGVGNLSLRRNSWAVYPIAPTTTEVLPKTFREV